MTRKVEGVGVYHPGDYVSVVPGTGMHTPEYRVWRDMLKRTHNKTHQARFPAYAGSSVCGEWLDFQTFAKWLHDNGFTPDKRLDKDILGKGAKHYSPATCCLVPPKINSVIVGKHGMYAAGVGKRKDRNGPKVYTAKCRDVDGVRRFLGTFETEEQAAKAYLFAKVIAVRQASWRAFDAGEITEPVLMALLDWRPT
jgi:hypothetical protein